MEYTAARHYNDLSGSSRDREMVWPYRGLIQGADILVPLFVMDKSSTLNPSNIRLVNYEAEGTLAPTITKTYTQPAPA